MLKYDRKVYNPKKEELKEYIESIKEKANKLLNELQTNDFIYINTNQLNRYLFNLRYLQYSDFKSEIENRDDILKELIYQIDTSKFSSKLTLDNYEECWIYYNFYKFYSFIPEGNAKEYFAYISICEYKTRIKNTKKYKAIEYYSKRCEENDK